MLIGTIGQIWRYPVKSMAGERLEQCTVDSLGIPGDRGWALRDETRGEMTNGKRIPQLMQCAARYLGEPGDGIIPHVEMTLPDGAHLNSDDREVNARLSTAFGKNLTLWPLQPAANKAHYRRANLGSRVAGKLSQFRSFRSTLPTLTSFGSMNAQVREMFSRETDEPIPDISLLPPDVIEFTSPLGTYFDAFPVHVLTTASLAAMAKYNTAAVWDVRRFRPNFLIETVDAIERLVEANWGGKMLRLGKVELKCEIPTARCGMPTQPQAELQKDPSVLRTIVKNADQNLGVYANVITNGPVNAGDRVELI